MHESIWSIFFFVVTREAKRQTKKNYLADLFKPTIWNEQCQKYHQKPAGNPFGALKENNTLENPRTNLKEKNLQKQNKN